MSRKLLLVALFTNFAAFSQLVFNDDFTNYTADQSFSG
jgi:hypothetical protein